ncbi:hypothetical protein FRC03_004509 [Tulasnella sp. 419]|nr:hypothetical protein FRC03_004509 [Tulasnella sp. 419]
MHSAVRPRSILKQAGRSHSSNGNGNIAPPCAVRFPSSPQLSTVYFTHCPSSYDRSPIIVDANTCALPERHCRNYDLSSAPPSSPPSSNPVAWGNHLHPSVMLAHDSSKSRYDNSLLAPPLVHDEGSSEESDGLASPPPELALSLPSTQYAPSKSHLYSAPLSHPPISQSSGSGFDIYSHSSSPAEYSAFLPHAPSKPCSSPKRRERKHNHDAQLKVQPVSFGSSWSQSEESSCLGGF